MDEKFHLSYVDEIPNGEEKIKILNWAKRIGFSLEELAMIQPGYCMAHVTGLYYFTSMTWFLIGLTLSVRKKIRFTTFCRVWRGSPRTYTHLTDEIKVSVFENEKFNGHLIVFFFF